MSAKIGGCGAICTRLLPMALKFKCLLDQKYKVGYCCAIKNDIEIGVEAESSQFEGRRHLLMSHCVALPCIGGLLREVTLS